MSEPCRWIRSGLAALFAGGLLAAVHACGGGGGDGDGAGMGTEGPVSRLEIEGVAGDTLMLAPGDSRAVAVETFDAQGHEIEDGVVAAATSDPAVATVSTSPSTDRLRLATVEFSILAVGGGRATITFQNPPSGSSADLPVRVVVSAPPPPPPPPPLAEVRVLTGNGARTFVSGSVVNGTVRVKAGTRVVWDWTDELPHSTTSDAVPPAWDSGILTGSANQFSRTFMTPGTFPYHCDVHGAPGIGMHGTIEVMP